MLVMSLSPVGCHAGLGVDEAAPLPLLPILIFILLPFVGEELFSWFSGLLQRESLHV